MHRVMMFMAVLASTAGFAAEERSFERRVAAEADGVVHISNVAGRVEVVGWDRNEVQVTGRLGERVERVDVRSGSGRTEIRVVLPRNVDGDGDAELEVRVPQASDLEVSTVSADVSARGVLGEQRLNTVSGDITSDLARSDVEVRTVSGDAVLRGSGQPIDVRATTVSGDLRIERGAGELEATTVSGDLTAALSPARAVRVRTTSGDLRFTGALAPGASLEAESISGELTVRASGQGGFEYQATSFSGDIETCFEAEAERTNRYGPGSRLDGVRGEGQGRVRLKTMSGEIELCDR